MQAIFMTKPLHHTILELPPPVIVLQLALQRSIEMVSFGLQAADTASVSELSIPGNFLKLAPAQDLALDPNAAKQEFRAWVLACGFRDIVDSLGNTLEWVRETCYYWSRPGKVMLTSDNRLLLQPQCPPEEVDAKVVKTYPRFDRLPLPNKFEHLENTYQLNLPVSKDAILSLNAARNCLTHRRGIVRPADLRKPSDQGLIVHIYKFDFMVSGPRGIRHTDNQQIILEDGETFSFRVISVERNFPLGERITFTPAEYNDVCSTFLIFALDLDKAVHELQDRRRKDLE
jgi:hypothetical protein